MPYLINAEAVKKAFVDSITVGEIEITREKLFLLDPFTAPYEENLPFLHPVPNGKFRVEIAVKTLENGDKRAVFAKIVFREIEAKYWEMGVTEESIDEDFNDGEFTGAVSETGYLAFADVNALQKLPSYKNEKSCFQFEEQLKKALDTTFVNTISYADYQQLLCFTAGWGEGLYPLFFGYEKEPNNEALYPVCAVVDLLVI